MVRLSKRIKDTDKWKKKEGVPPIRERIIRVHNRSEQLKENLYRVVASILRDQYGINPKVARYVADKMKNSWRGGISGKNEEQIAKKLVKSSKKLEEEWRNKGLI